MAVWRHFLVLLLLVPGAFAQAPTRVATTMSGLLAMKPGDTQPHVQVLGLSAPGDWGPPKTFRYDPTNALPTNAVRRATAISSGRWIHDWDGDARAFGVKADGTTDDRTNIQAAADFAMAQKIGFYVSGNVTSRLSGPIEARSDFHIYGKNGYWSLLGDYSGSKGDTNYGGIIRTLNAKFPAWGDPLVVQHSRIKIESVALLRNWPNGGTNTGPLLMIDHASDVSVRDVRLLATNHYDWATFFRANNCHGSQIRIRTKGAWGQDGWHIYAGTNHTLVDFDIESGDDSVAVGSERDQWIENFSIGPGIAVSDASRALAVFQATYSTTPPAPPTNFIRYGVFHDIVAHGGQRTNWPIVIEEYSGANNTHTAEPPRVVSDIVFDNIVTTRGAHTNFGAGAIRIEGTDRITIANTSVTNGNFAGIWLNKSRNTSLRNVSMSKTVRTGSTGGSAGLYAFDNSVYGLNIEGGYYEAATGLHTILVRGATNVSVRGATIAGVSGQYGVWLDRTTNFLVSENIFTGPQAINLGPSNAVGQVFGNVFDGSVTTRVTWNGATANTYVEDSGILYPTKVFSPEVTVGSQSSQANAALAVVSTTRGFQPPRMSQAQVDAISSPTLGLTAVDNDLGAVTIHNGSAWRVVPLWPRSRISVGSSGAATFSTIDGSNTPIIASSSNSWPLVATMQGASTTFGSRIIARRSMTNGAEVLDDTELGGILFAGSYTNTGLFSDGDAGMIGRTTVNWTDVAQGAELVFSAQATNATSRTELLVLNADYGTGQLPILIRKADATYKRIGITNVGGNDTLYLIP